MATHDRPASRLRGRLLVLVVAALLLGLAPWAGALAATPDAGAAPADDAPAPTDSGPSTTEPDHTSDTGAEDPDGRDDTDDGAAPVNWVAVGAAAALLGVAVWWMLRHGNDEPPTVDDDQGTGSEVI
jgi:hypothetical protein